MSDILPISDIIINDEEDITPLFDTASQALFNLERALRRREINSKASNPIHKMRWGVSQLKKFYDAGETVCDKNTKYDEYLENNP